MARCGYKKHLLKIDDLAVLLIHVGVQVYLGHIWMYIWGCWVGVWGLFVGCLGVVGSSLAVC